MPDLTHADLVARAVRWLRGSMRCQPVLAEVVSAAWETPDAIGWKRGYSVLVECKVSRRDFLVDKHKISRRHPTAALGDYRWYLTRPGLITPGDVEASGWGLAVVDGRRIHKLVTPVRCARQEAGIRGDLQLLASVLRRYQAQGIDYKPVLDAPNVPLQDRPS